MKKFLQIFKYRTQQNHSIISKRKLKIPNSAQKHFLVIGTKKQEGQWNLKANISIKDWHALLAFT